ncbi:MULTISPECIES: alpha/beta hydrolase [Cytobacillus]|uniref:alpha/beta hydrolase n=1 Tax=Cytobacillus TaxID=2675230 RepID=UPI000DE87FC6|nr:MULTISPECIES: alpha/beta hydrolase [Cytobacillus]
MSNGREWNSFFAKNGFFVVNINYRLSGEAIFPAQIHDCKTAARWLSAKHFSYNINPEKIGVWGHSAGGHLAAHLATSFWKA